MVAKMIVLGTTPMEPLECREHCRQRWSARDLQEELEANSVALLPVKEFDNLELGKVGAKAFDKATSDSGEFPPGMWKMAPPSTFVKAGEAARPMLDDYIRVFYNFLTGSDELPEHPYRWAEESLAIVVDEEGLLRENPEVNLRASFFTGHTLVNKVAVVLKSSLAD